jgi:hypothetical protein
MIRLNRNDNGNPTNKDPDIDTDLKEKPPSTRVRNSSDIQEPQYLAGLDIPIGKFTMHDMAAVTGLAAAGCYLGYSSS